MQISPPIHQHRGGLRRTLQAIRQGKVTLGFIGGSITDPRPGWNWPEPVCAWFYQTFPGLRVVVENAAIGATGSDLAVFRARRDLIERGCDLVFVEFAVNDADTPSTLRGRTREGLLRKLLAGEGRDLVLVYTYRQGMYAEMTAGQVPASIAEFERLGEHYQLGSVWMGLHSLREVQQGLMRWEDWLPDGLHPQQRGSLSYAQSVTAYLRRELIDAPSTRSIPLGADLPAALDPQNWETASTLPFDAVRLAGPWTVQRWTKYSWIDQVLHTAAPGARLEFEFSGRGLALGLDFGRYSAEFRYRIDAGLWQDSDRERPDWVGAEGWYRLSVLAEDLAPGKHTFALEVVHGNPLGDRPGTAYAGTNFDLGLIGIIP
jgi:hypothetical protein